VLAVAGWCWLPSALLAPSTSGAVWGPAAGSGSSGRYLLRDCSGTRASQPCVRDACLPRCHAEGRWQGLGPGRVLASGRGGPGPLRAWPVRPLLEGATARTVIVEGKDGNSPDQHGYRWG
jgi:hypothetical protein